MNFNEQLQTFLQSHIEQISRNLNNISEGVEQLLISQFPEKFMIDLANRMLKICESEPPLLKLDPPITVIGDLHGHLLNLYQILQICDMPPNTKYLFLGDIVDRGYCSLETASLIFALKICYPDFVYVIRGNHEFSTVSLTGGFFDEVTSIYNSQNIFNAFNSAFEYFPVAALVGSNYLCLHGGISPDLKFLSQLTSIERPIKEYSNPILCGLFWSDPQNEVTKFQSSIRGVGFLFGSKPLIKFLNRNNLQILIRGHECVDGYSFAFDQKCITVFSASNYCGQAENHSSILKILDDSTLKPVILDYIKFIQRSSAIITNSKFSMYTDTNFNSYISIPQIKTPQMPRLNSLNFSTIGGMTRSLSKEQMAYRKTLPKHLIMTNSSLTSKKVNMRAASKQLKLTLDEPETTNENEKVHFHTSIPICPPNPSKGFYPLQKLAKSEAKFKVANKVVPINPTTKWRTNNANMSSINLKHCSILFSELEVANINQNEKPISLLENALEPNENS